MSDRYRLDPPDEPIIGGNYPPPVHQREPAEPIIGGNYAAAGYATPPRYEEEWEDADDEAYDADADGYSERGYDGYDDNPSLTRQPLFYAIIALSLLVLGGLGALAFALAGDNDSPTADFSVTIDAPGPNDRRITVGNPLEVAVQATSKETIVSFSLFVDRSEVDRADVTGTPEAIERATLKTTFTRRGEYEVFVRVTTASGATKDSEAFKVVVTEQVGDLPSSIKGKIVAAVNARTGPGDNFEVVGSLPGGEEITIKGKTRAGDWLLVDASVGHDVWVRRTAVEPSDSLSLVPIKEATPTPRPQPTNTLAPSATASPSATPDTNMPDFLPVGAVLIDGGSKLRITVQNNGGDYTGPLVVSVGGLGPGTETLAFNVNILSKGTATVEFNFSPASQGGTARVQVDPDNAIKESAEDNNAASFSVSVPVEQPNIVIAQVTLVSGQAQVQVRNDGGALATTTVVVRIVVGGNAVEQSKTIALAKGQAEVFTVANPPKGTGTVSVIVGGQQVASQAITIP